MLNGKQDSIQEENSTRDEDSARDESSAIKWTFVKAHALLFTGRSNDDFGNCVNALLGDMLIDNINRAGPQFKKVGVIIIIANYATLFKYKTLRPDDSSRSVLRRAFEKIKS